MLLRRAETAADAGNYGIAAALVVRSGGRELVSLANNTVFADHDPAGHAEMNAIRQAHEAMLGHAMVPTPAGEIVRQHAPSRATEMILFATLEPCPMCTVCAINARVSQVVIATPDPLAGATAPERLSTRAPAS
jgi:tRNA(adenine34) deaminase